MNDVTLIALSKALAKQAKNIELAPGSYIVEDTVTLDVNGILNKGESVEYTPTVDIPLLLTMALLMEKMGFQRELCKTLLIESMTEALQAEKQGADHVAERLKDIEKAMIHVRQVTEALPKKFREGPTTAKILVGEPEVLAV